MTSDKKIRKDGLFSVLGGVDSGNSPSLIGQDQIGFGINVTARGGFLTNRPGFDQRGLIFDNTEQQDWIRTHAVQGGDTFQSLKSRDLHIVSIGGRIFAVDPIMEFHIQEITPTAGTSTASGFVVPAVGSDVTVDVADAGNIFVGYPISIAGNLYMVASKLGNTLTLTNINDTPGNAVPSPVPVTYLDPNDPNQPIAWMAQADKWWVIQNGLDGAIIYDGASSRRAAIDEVPVGTAMVFNEEIQRLCVGTVDNQIAIGDTASGPTSAIKFTESNYLAEGGAFRIPFRFGKITAMAMIANLDRSNGQGGMIVFAERGITAFALPPNRSVWKDVQQPIQLNLPLRYSASSQAGTVQINGDIFYGGKDGEHSFAYANREFRSWGNKSQSRELNRVLRQNTERLLKYQSAILFDNRLLFTVLPLPSRNGVYHRAIAVLDFDLTSSLRGDSPAAYDGFWTGIQPTLLFTGEFGGEERAFAWSRNAAGHNEFWEISKDHAFDNETIRITSSIETRSLSFGDPTELTRALACDLWIDNLQDQVDFDLKWKPDQHPCWFNWATESECNKLRDCANDPLICKTLKDFKPSYRTRIGFGTPPDINEPMDGKSARVSYEQQIRLEWTGKVEIRKMLLKNQIVEELEFGNNTRAVVAANQSVSSSRTAPPICIPEVLVTVNGV